MSLVMFLELTVILKVLKLFPSAPFKYFVLLVSFAMNFGKESHEINTSILQLIVSFLIKLKSLYIIMMMLFANVSAVNIFSFILSFFHDMTALHSPIVEDCRVFQTYVTIYFASSLVNIGSYLPWKLTFVLTVSGRFTVIPRWMQDCRSR